MTAKRRVTVVRGKRKAKKPSSTKRVRTSSIKAKAEAKKSVLAPRKADLQQPVFETMIREREIITVDDIRGDTAIGDLLVTFPRTRDVLVGKGLRLEAENAGDIYMNLEAFSAMNGLRIETLIQELVETAKEPPLQPPTLQLTASPNP